MDPLKRSLRFPCEETAATGSPLLREWLVTNGLGGYASGTLCGVSTRRYHGLLIAALPSPLGRTMMLNRLAECVGTADGTSHALGLDSISDNAGAAADTGHLAEFRLEDGLPVWRFELAKIAIEKRLLLTYRQNTAYLIYRLVSGETSVPLTLRPLIH